ncbi:MAG: replicase [Bramycfau virus 3]|nr:MAG: replicase [Bramycfau virus 3]
MNRLGFTSVLMLTERITSAISTYEWYLAHPLPEIGKYRMRAGGQTRSDVRSTKPAILASMTTGAFVQAGCKYHKDTLIILDECHNLTTDTAIVMEKVNPKSLVMMSATPPQPGAPLSIRTPYPAIIDVGWFNEQDVINKLNLNESCLHVHPTVSAAVSAAGYYRARVKCRVFCITREVKFELVGKERKPFTIAQLLKVHGTFIVSATDVLQESVTLPIVHVFDEGMRCRPENNPVERLNDLSFYEDQHLMHRALSLRVRPQPLTRAEFGQVVGRVGRIEGLKSHAHVKIERGFSGSVFSYDAKRLRGRGTLKVDDDWVRRRSQVYALIDSRTADLDWSRIQDDLNSVYKGTYMSTVEFDDWTASLLKTVEPKWMEMDPEGDPNASDSSSNCSVVVKALKFDIDGKRIDGFNNTKLRKAQMAFMDKQNAKPKARRSRRGGKKAKLLRQLHEPGRCALKAIKWSKRLDYVALLPVGATVNELVTVAKHDLRRRNAALVLKGDKYHVEVVEGWPTTQQIDWLLQNGAKDVVVAADADYADMEEIAAEIWMVHKLYNVDDGAEYQCDEELLANPPGLPDDEFESETEAPRCVKAPGQCWRRMGAYVDDLGQDDPDNVTVEQILPYLEDAANWWSWLPIMNVQLMDDGDWHIEEAHWRNSRAWRDPVLYEQLLNEFPGWITIWEFEEKLKEHGMNKRVSSGTANSAYDIAMMQFRTPEVQRTNEGYLSGMMASAARQIREDCPFAIPPANRKYANEYHINYSLSVGVEHPHPIHNALRRRQCKDILPKYVNGDVTVVSMSEANTGWLTEGMEHLGKVHEVHKQNPLVELRDLGRYLGDPDSVPAEVFNLDRIKTSHAIFHDCGHFLDEGFLLQLFMTNPELKVVITTSVFPLESLVLGQSSRPTLYEWVHLGDNKMMYIPEGDRGGAYFQSSDAGLLLCNNIVSRGGTYRLKGAVVDSVMNCYVQVWSPFEFLVPESIPLEMDGVMPIPRVFSQMPKNLAPVPKDLYADLIKYGRNLPSGMSSKDAWGKIRTQTIRDYPYIPVGDLEWLVKVVMLITKSTCTFDAQSKLITSFPEEAYYHTIGKLVRLKQRMFSRRYAENIRELINEPHHFSAVPLTTRIVSLAGNCMTYGVEWKIPKDGHPWWLRIKPWLQKWVGRCDEGQNISIAADDVLRFEYNSAWITKLFNVNPTISVCLNQKSRKIPEGQCLGYTKVNVNRFGLENMKKHQIQQITKAFFPGRLIPEEERTASDSSSDSDDSSSEGSDDTIATSIIESDINHMMKVSHCEECPTFEEWDTDGHSLHSEYILAMLQRHLEACTRQEERRAWVVELARLTMRKAARAAMFAETRRSVDTFLPVVDINDKQVRRSTAEERDALSEAVSEIVSDGDLTVPEELPALDEIALAPTVLPAPKKLIKAAPWEVPYEEQREGWLKLVKAKPGLTVNLSNFPWTGRWDRVFPLSQDKRITQMPYRFMHYPMAKYPKQPCLLEAAAYLLRKKPEEVYTAVNSAWPTDLDTQNVDMLPHKVLHAIGCRYQVKFVIIRDGLTIERYGMESKLVMELKYQNNHLIPGAVKGAMMINQLNTVTYDMPRSAIKMLKQIEDMPGAVPAEYAPSRERAAQYVREIMDGGTGTFAEAPVNLETLKGWEEMVTKADMFPRRLYTFEGEAGCGKSYGLTKILQNKSFHTERCFNISLPTTVLADDWRAKLGVRDPNPATGKGTPFHYVTTFERTLASGCWGWLMVWDEDKFPKGYMDLVMFLFPHVKTFAFCCDRYQTEWHEPNSKCRLNDPNILGNARLMTAVNKVYIRGTMRGGPGVANFQRTITFNNHPGGYHFTEVMPKQWADIQPFFPGLSEDQIKALWKDCDFYYAAHVNVHWAEQLAGQDAVTFAGSQGLTSELAVVEIDMRVIKMTVYRLLHTVLNRARNYIIVCNYVNDGTLNRWVDANAILKELLWYKDNYQLGTPVTILPEHSYQIEDVLNEPMPDDVRTCVIREPDKCVNREFISNFPRIYKALDDQMGANKSGRLRFEGFYEDKYTFKSRIVDFQEPVVNEPGYEVGTMAMALGVTHLPKSNYENLVEMHFSKVPTRFAAELSWRNLYSEQKPDLPMFKKNANEILKRIALSKKVKIGQILRKLPGRWEKGFEDRPDVFMPHVLSLGLDQKSTDKASFQAGVDQRIRVGTYLENMEEIQDTASYGKALFAAFCKSAGWNAEERFPLTAQQREDATLEFSKRRADRSEALKMMSLNRSEPDYVDFLSAKTQWKMKESEHLKAKGLQPIFVRSDEYLFRFGWIGVHMLNCLKRDLPPHIYIHAQETIERAKSWFMTFTENYEMHEMLDMSGLDGSVRGGAVNMMVCFLQRYGVPEEDVEFYVNDKANFHTRTKHFALMTLSGEIFTYLINTLFTVSREMLKYDIPFGFPIAVTGDDVDRQAGLLVSPRWRLFERFDFCVEKRFQSNVGEFASFKINKGVLYKDPVILFGRLLGQLERGKQDDISLGYFELFSHAYMLKDQLYSVMSEEELEHQDAINYVMFNLKKFGCTTKLPWHKLHIGGLSMDDMQGSKREMYEAILNSSERDDMPDIQQELGLFDQGARIREYTSQMLSSSLFQE